MSHDMGSMNQVSSLKPAAYGGKRSRKNRSSNRHGGTTLKMGGRKHRKHRKSKSNRRK